MGSAYRLCSASLNGTVVSTLNNATWSSGLDAYVGGASGNYQGDFVANMRQVPAVSLVTRKIDALSEVTLGNGNLIFRQMTEGGTGNSTYLSLTGTNSYTLLIPRRISWAAGRPAELAIDMVFLSSSGSAAPITVGSTTGGTSAETKIWSGDDEQCDRIDLDFGYNVVWPADGKLYAKHCFVMDQRPVLTAHYTHLDGVTTTNLNPGSVSSLTCILAELAEGGIRGTQLSISVTGLLHAAGIESGTPAGHTLTVNGKGGVTFA